MASSAARSWFPLLAALALAVAFRLPALVNANALTSDAAIVGVQARHFVDGEFAARLWGSPYQAPLDVVLAAGLFLLGGSSPLLLLLVPLLGMLAMITLAYVIVARHTGPKGALLAVLPLIFATQAVNSPMVYVLRQSLATWVVLAICCLELAVDRARPTLWFAAGGALLGLGLFIDVFCAVLVPPVLLFGALRAWAVPGRLRALAALGLSFLVGLVPTLLLSGGSGQTVSWVSLQSAAHIFRANRILLWHQCLPFALGVRVWLPDSIEWLVPLPVQVLQLAAAVVFVAALSSGLVLGVKTRVHALGVLGVTGALCALGGFVFSNAPFDMWSTRYLAPMLWLAPFALAPLLARVGPKRGAMVVIPWALSALISGWASYGEFVDGPSIVRTQRGKAIAELELGRLLREKGVHHGKAQYWQAYRLSLLWGEDPLVVPLEPELDREPGARSAVESAAKVASIFHPSEPRASAADFEARLVAEGRAYERLAVEDFVVFLTQR